jgi:hypothetical protein
VAGCKTLQTNILLHVEERNIPLTLKTPGVTALFLLECKKCAWNLKDTTLNNNLIKFNQTLDFNKINAQKSGVFKHSRK